MKYIKIVTFTEKYIPDFFIDLQRIVLFSTIFLVVEEVVFVSHKMESADTKSAFCSNNEIKIY